MAELRRINHWEFVGMGGGANLNRQEHWRFMNILWRIARIFEPLEDQVRIHQIAPRNLGDR